MLRHARHLDALARAEAARGPALRQAIHDSGMINGDVVYSTALERYHVSKDRHGQAQRNAEAARAEAACIAEILRQHGGSSYYYGS
jgi:hypothetical protein